MFDPVSTLPYRRLAPEAQVLVVACPVRHGWAALEARWATRACAVLADATPYVRDVVRDLLANPQLRVIVFDGPICGRAAWEQAWGAGDAATWRFDAEHIQLVRQFVSLYDDDFRAKTTLQPFWPVRIRYQE